MELTDKEIELLHLAGNAELEYNEIQFQYGEQSALDTFKKEFGDAFQALMTKGLVEGDICFGGCVILTQRGRLVLSQMRDYKVKFRHDGRFTATEKKKTLTDKLNRKGVIISITGVIIGIISLLITILLLK